MSRSDFHEPASSFPKLDALQHRMGYQFKNPRLLARALTHKSFSQEHYERLEFLGDAVLSLAVSDMLYSQFDRSDEGDLTRVRAHLVRQETLHKLAVAMGLPECLRMSEGEAKGGGAQRPSILADAVEAILGAIYLDAGFAEAQALVGRLIKPVLAQGATLDSWTKDAKTALQEWLQARKMPVPTYRIDATRGKAHEQVFVVACELPALGIAVLGEGLSRRAAEQAAAEIVLAQIKDQPPVTPKPTVVVKKRTRAQ